MFTNAGDERTEVRPIMRGEMWNLLRISLSHLFGIVRSTGSFDAFDIDHGAFYERAPSSLI
jgi:hypothetical protein